MVTRLDAGITVAGRPYFAMELVRGTRMTDHCDQEVLSTTNRYSAKQKCLSLRTVFPKIEPLQDGSFHRRFFLHNWRNASLSAQKQLQSLEPGDNLKVAIELSGLNSKPAVQIQTRDYHLIGWAPQYLALDLINAFSIGAGNYTARVVQINPAPAPSKQRVLVELSGHWPGYEPRTMEDFAPLVE